MSQRCSGPMWPEALQSASWNWNWSTRLRKYLGREGEAGWGCGRGGLGSAGHCQVGWPWDTAGSLLPNLLDSRTPTPLLLTSRDSRHTFPSRCPPQGS